MPNDERALARGEIVPPRGAELRSTAREMTSAHATIVVRSALTFGAMLLYHASYIPCWALVLANVALYPEIYLRIHDIGHACSPSRFGWAARFVPVTNPIWGGTRVFSTVHREHHAHLGTDKDPWGPYYTGHPLRALFFNFIEPEYSFRQFVRLRGVDAELVLNVVYNVLCFAFGAHFFRGAYVTSLVSQRVVHAIGIFFFNFYTHRATLSAKAPIGTWERSGDLARYLPLLRAIWGRDTIDGLIYHNRHHCIGQQHVPVRYYQHLTDTGLYTRDGTVWPIADVRRT